MREVAIWVAGGVGLSIVARAAALYRGSDRLAFGLIGLIAVGLLVGVIELVMRARRAGALAREIAELPKEPTEETVDAASAPVRSFLRGRIAGNGTWSSTPPIASYLIGLLVMIGLLGTFLGLFESLRGARDALSASADPATLRAGLAAPIQGLSRAFGTSAAGVSASAMLGLALVVVRRAESEVASALSAYASGPLAPLTVARRTLAALESIASRNSALPDAASALTSGAASLGEVAREVRGAMTGMTAVVREELHGVSGSTAKAVADAFTKSIAAESEARASRDAAHAKAMQDAIAREAKIVVDAVTKGQNLLVEAEAARADTVAKALRTNAETVGSSLLAIADGIQTKLAAQTESDRARDARLESIVASVESLGAKLAEDLATHQRMLDASAATRFEAHVESTASRLAQWGERLEAIRAELRADDQLRAAAVGDRMTEQLDALAAKVSGTIAASLEPVLTAAESATSAHASREESLRAVADRVAELASAVDVRLATHQKEVAHAMAIAIEAHGEQAANKLATFVGELEKVRAALRADDDARATEVTARMEQQLASLATSVSSALEGVVQSTQAAPEAAARVIDDAAERLRVQLEAESAREAKLGELVDRVATLASTVEATTTARLDAHAVATSEKLEAHLEALALSVGASLEGVMKSVEAAKQSDADRDARIVTIFDKLDGLAARIDAQTQENAERILALEIKLEEAYKQSADAWTDRLALHAASVQDHFLQTTVVVKDAADVLGKSSTDVASLANLFGGSVERYREASEKWLSGLSIMRAAAERAASADAQDLLAAYLEQTREVFDQTVQFQRQLFAELRRHNTTATPETPIGEAE